MSPETPDDLAWLAFRYVAGELTDAETDAFEARLDDDQAAREAVAEAVGLIAGVQSRKPRPRSVLPGRTPVRPARLAMAACLLAGLTLGLAWLGRGRPDPAPAVAPAPAVLAVAWSGLQADDPSATEPAQALPWLDESAEGEDGGLDPAAEGETDDGLPSWLVEAVVLRQGS